MPFRLTGESVLALWRAPAGAIESAPARPEDVVIGLFDRFRDPLLRYLLTFGLGIADGEEVMQETFLLLHQHIQQEKSRANLRGWIFRVAHNLALKRRYRMLREDGALTCSPVELTADSAPDPEAQAVASQREERLVAILSVLPEVDRRCLALRAEGLRYREIAATLDISLGSVSISLARSLARMSRAVER
ncbi:MAG TPA: sigma-70 family RNA polymerase sigma factor [Bryobacteraceae bacterium]|nr:sigma-70 family RNA polymerase sigma factor [Bryobacteraceae bacterium]